MEYNYKNKTEKNIHTDENAYRNETISEINCPNESWITEPFPESTRPRKDGPGGEN